MIIFSVHVKFWHGVDVGAGFMCTEIIFIVMLRSMKRSKSSRHWLKEHFTDPFVKQAQKEGFRARSVYKLKEIHDRHRIIKPSMVVVDLGAAPGGWSEFVAGIVGAQGKVFALDILAMAPIEGVTIVQGDFSQDEVYQILLEHLSQNKVDIVLSDMAPNMSGIKEVDQARAMHLIERAYDFALKVLKPGGAFLTKIFQGAGFDEMLKLLRTNFTEVKIIKPSASRSRSKEIYFLARGLKTIEN